MFGLRPTLTNLACKRRAGGKTTVGSVPLCQTLLVEAWYLVFCSRTHWIHLPDWPPIPKALSAETKRLWPVLAAVLACECTVCKQAAIMLLLALASGPLRLHPVKRGADCWNESRWREGSALVRPAHGATHRHSHPAQPPCACASTAAVLYLTIQPLLFARPPSTSSLSHSQTTLPCC